MFSRFLRLLVAPLALSTAACGGTVDVSGTYRLDFERAPDECGLEVWPVGERNEAVETLVLQADDDQVQVDIGAGTPPAFLLVPAGDTVFVGEASGARVRADLEGSSEFSRGTCTYRWGFELDLRLQGDCFEGDLAWVPVTDGDPSCGQLDDCRNTQLVSGCRPPMEPEAP
ncbi:MAG: hypothetical protein ACFCGT_15890 [Sandaracinaceae bacterium]